MKRILVLIFSLVVAMAVGAQRPGIKILVLSPAKRSIDPSLAKQADSLVKAMKKDMQRDRNDRLNRNVSENDHRNAQSVTSLLPKLNIYNLASTFLCEALYFHLSYGRGFEDILMPVLDTSTNDKQVLKNLALRNGVSYVVSFPEVAYYKRNGEVSIILSFQLYDLANDSILIKKEYTGNEFTQIAEDYCGEKTLPCLLQDGTTQAASDLVDALSGVHPFLKAHREKFRRDSTLDAQRTEILLAKYFTRPWDGSLPRSVIDKDPTIDLKDMYYSMQNAEKTRFLAFFAGSPAKKEAGDRFDGSSETQMYMVRGMLYNGRWIYNKMQDNFYLVSQNTEDAKRSFFSDLKNMEFFTENDTTFNKNFWESGPFGKVPDLTKDPRWEEMKKAWQSLVEYNREYIGMYEIVAEKIRNDKYKAREKFADSILHKFIKPLISASVKPVYGREDEETPELYFPQDMSVAIGALKVTGKDGITKIQYFVVLTSSNEIYQWTKFNPVIKDNYFLPGYMLQQISSLTREVIKENIVEDKNFWNNHVLLKEDGQYKYLKPIK